MDKSATLRAKDLLPATRQWIAEVLHVELADDDELTFELRRAAESEQSRRKAEARQRLLDLLAKMDEKTGSVSDDEMDRAIEEAIQHVRADSAR